MTAFRPPWLHPSSPETAAFEPHEATSASPVVEEATSDSSAADSDDEQAEKGPDRDPKTGKFLKGFGGRKKGSRNKVTLAVAHMLENEAQDAHAQVYRPR